MALPERLTIRRAVALVVLLVGTGGCRFYAPTWSAVHADSANTDFARVEGARSVALSWTRSFDGSINLGPTIDRHGQVYVTTSGVGCHLHALDARTGETRWCSADVDRFASMSSPVIDVSGKLYLADGEAMRAFDRDGAVLWETPIVGVPLSAQFTSHGRIVFVTHVGRIYMLRRSDGAEVIPPVELIPGATFDPADGVLACMRGTEECPSANTPAVDLRRNRLFFTFWEPGAQGAEVRAMRISEHPTASIKPLWSNDSLPGGSASSPTLSRDGTRVYVNDNAGSMHALDAATGETVWSYEIGFAVGGSPSLSPDGLLMPAGGGASPVLALRDDGDHATLAWRRDTMLNRGVATQARGRLAYVTVAAGDRYRNDLVIVDTRTGVERDRDEIPGVSVFTVGTTIGPDGRVYVPTFLGDLHAYDPA